MVSFPIKIEIRHILPTSFYSRLPQEPVTLLPYWETPLIPQKCGYEVSQSLVLQDAQHTSLRSQHYAQRGGPATGIYIDGALSPRTNAIVGVCLLTFIRLILYSDEVRVCIPKVASMRLETPGGRRISWGRPLPKLLRPGQN